MPNQTILSGLQSFMNDRLGVDPGATAAGGEALSPVSDGTDDPTSPGPGRIPLPDYKDPASRLAYAKAYRTKYGNYFEGRGDIPLRVNEKPAWATDTAKNLATRFGGQYGIDPALLYGSAMEEGMSGAYANKEGRINTTGDKNYPVSGLWSFGLDSFDQGRFDSMVKKGLLPKEFANNFTIFQGEGGPAGKDVRPETAMFKTTDAGLQAKAAMMKEAYDDMDTYAKQHGIAMSPKARDFFTLATFNGGEGVGHQMLSDYSANGLLKNDAYLKTRPTSGKGLKESSYKQVYDNVRRRLVYQTALKEQGQFEDTPAGK